MCTMDVCSPQGVNSSLRERVRRIFCWLRSTWPNASWWRNPTWIQYVAVVIMPPEAHFWGTGRIVWSEMAETRSAPLILFFFSWAHVLFLFYVRLFFTWSRAAAAGLFYFHLILSVIIIRCFSLFLLFPFAACLRSSVIFLLRLLYLLFIPFSSLASVSILFT